MERNEEPDNHHSTLEVDHRTDLPELDSSPHLPQVASNNDLPEARPTGDYPEVLDGSKASAKRTTICGLRRKTIWLLLSAALLAIVAVAVGVGVGVGRNHRSRGGSSEPNNGGNSTVTTQRAGRIATFSRLAAVNYTDRQERDHSQVYYQDGNLDLWMADLDMSSKAWNFTKTNTTGMEPKNGTAISAYNWPYASGAQRYDFHMRFISTSNTIRALYGEDELLKSSWAAPKSVDNIWQATADSSLALHGGDCGSSFCDQADYMVFRSSNAGRPLAAAYPYVSPGFASVLPGDGGDAVVADDGTALAKAPIPALARRNDTFPRAAVYFSANNGSLREMYGARNQSWNVTDMSVPNITLDAGSQLAAMSSINDAGLLYVQVLATRRVGGVAVAYLDGGPDAAWTSNASVAGMEGVLPLSPIAATQMGRVYALERGGDDAGPELVEWVRTAEVGVPTFERVGVVNTTVV